MDAWITKAVLEYLSWAWFYLGNGFACPINWVVGEDGHDSIIWPRRFEIAVILACLAGDSRNATALCRAPLIYFV